MPRKRVQSTVEVRSNLELVLRERGKVFRRVKGHNIWLNLGREYLAELISYASFGPDTPVRDDRIKYIGLGIGGTKQVAPSVANNAPIVTAYPGNNLFTDADPTITTLERPVRISGGSSAPPYVVPTDVWVGQIQAPPTYPQPGHVTFKRVFSQAELSYSPFLVVPLSEVGLFTGAADPAIYNNTAVAYDTFPTLSKTGAFDLEVSWTVRF